MNWENYNGPVDGQEWAQVSYTLGSSNNVVIGVAEDFLLGIVQFSLDVSVMSVNTTISTSLYNHIKGEFFSYTETTGKSIFRFSKPYSQDQETPLPAKKRRLHELKVILLFGF